MAIIDRSLTHRCTISGTRTQSGIDKYNRPTYTVGAAITDVPCFFTAETKSEVDVNGEDHVRVITLLLSRKAVVDVDSRISAIQMGKVTIRGEYEVASITPVSGYRDLSHYELTLREV